MHYLLQDEKALGILVAKPENMTSSHLLTANVCNTDMNVFL